MTGTEPKVIDETQVGYVYLVHNPRTGFYKVGSARRPHTRLAQLCREMRAKCSILHTIATNHMLRLERETQERFLDQHQGGEWFDLTAFDVTVIQAVSTVWYKGGDLWVPGNRRRVEFDIGAKWAEALPICGAA